MMLHTLELVHPGWWSQAPLCVRNENQLLQFNSSAICIDTPPVGTNLPNLRHLHDSKDSFRITQVEAFRIGYIAMHARRRFLNNDRNTNVIHFNGEHPCRRQSASREFVKVYSWERNKQLNAITDAAEWLNATMSQLLHNTDMIASQSDSSFATPNIVTTSTELLVNDKSYMQSYTLPHLTYLTWTKSFLSRSWHVLNL